MPKSPPKERPTRVKAQVAPKKEEPVSKQVERDLKEYERQEKNKDVDLHAGMTPEERRRNERHREIMANPGGSLVRK